MADYREQILDRLLAIAGGVEGVSIAVRNTLDIPDTRLPAIVILDADEAAEEADPSSRPPKALRRINMTPQIYILLADSPADLGQEVNIYRARLIKAVMTDATLKALTLDGTGIRYDGCVTSLAAGREMIGDLAVSFTFTYVLNPADL